MTGDLVDIRAERVRRNLAALRALATEPARADRLRAHLAALDEGESMERFVDRAKAVRMDPALLARCEALMEAVSKDPELRSIMGRLSVSAVVRLAADRGVAELERLFATPPDGER